MITLTQQNYTFNLQPIANQLFQIKNSRGPRLGAPKTKLPVQTIQFAGFANIGQNEFQRLLNGMLPVRNNFLVKSSCSFIYFNNVWPLPHLIFVSS